MNALAGKISKATIQLILLALSLGLGALAIEAQQPRDEDDENVLYYVIHNETDSVLREVHILMDEVDFTDAKLRRLMGQFRQKYKEPNMWVFLYSKLDQLYFFAGNEPSLVLSNVYQHKAPKPWNKYAGGILIYRGVDQVIRYNTVGSERHTLIVTGIDPADGPLKQMQERSRP